MKIRIRQVSTRYNDDNTIESIAVNYQGNNQNGSLSISGTLTISQEEYDENSTIDALETLAKADIFEKLNEED